MARPKTNKGAGSVRKSSKSPPAAKRRPGVAKDNGKVKSHPTSFWLDDETKAILERLMQEFDISRSEVVRDAIRRMGADDDRNEIRRLVDALSNLA